MDPLTLGIAVSALLHTIWRQYQFDQTCKDCPYRKEKEK
jgi:hypothetical protein